MLSGIRQRRIELKQAEAEAEARKEPEVSTFSRAVVVDYGVKRAKAQEDSQTDGEISVKLLDSENAVVGDAFDVYAFPDKAATDMTDYLPDIDTNDVLLVSKANDGKWYLVWPTLNYFETITVQTNYQVDGANSELEKKTRSNVKVFATDAESAWTVVHTGTECP